MNESIKMLIDKGFDIVENEPMKKHTTFQIGGPADYFAVPGSIDELKELIAVCRENGLPYFILGNGSNLLVSDNGYRGVVINIAKAFSEIIVQDTTINAGAGAMLRRVAEAAKCEGLTGMEFASGIPGTIGGAIVMNAGAYGGEMVQIVKNVTVLTKEGELLDIPVEKMEMAYRTSCILPKEYIVIEVELELAHGNKDDIIAVMKDLAAKRKEKQPLEYPSAGSTFKRPEGYFAGKLIQDAGLRGYTVGGACVSEKHCGFVVNKGNATCADVKKLCEDVNNIVTEKFGVPLEMEIKILGD